MISINFLFLILIIFIFIIYLLFRLIKCNYSISKINNKINNYSNTKSYLKDKINIWQQKNQICKKIKEPFVCMASIGTGPSHRDAFETDTPNARSCDMTCPGNIDFNSPYNKYDPSISFIRGVGQCCNSIGKQSLQEENLNNNNHDPTDHLINEPGNGNQNNNNGSIEFGTNGCIDLSPNSSNSETKPGQCLYDNGSGPNVNIGEIQQTCMKPKKPIINNNTTNNTNTTNCPIPTKCPTITSQPIIYNEEEENYLPPLLNTNILPTIYPTILPTNKPQFIKLNKGEPGTNSNCLSTGCIYDDKYCVKKYGQCGILEHEVQQKCGDWDLCKGVVCRDDYNGYCLARGELTNDNAPTMWGYKKN